ncbi:MAG TPA: helix-turn-helix transcriptional regulator [Acidimicrobiales bacterium]|nr:helix-turn-helix transcriptional regulator [Acidimicrobiales bacterium]
MTQAELGEFAGVDRSTVANLENARLTAQVRRLLAILDALGLHLTVTPRTRLLATAAADDGNPAN